MLLLPDTGARTRGDLLLTGSTGFLGMELLARLLEDTDRRVWAPVRAGSDEQATERVREVLASLVADPEACLDRVIPVAADLTLPALGLDARRHAEIAHSVDEIIHAAASVSFTLPLAKARAVNVEGTRRMLELAWLCEAHGGLRRFAHVSTAYVAGDHRGEFSETDLEAGQGFHNTYEQTKWEAEGLVRANAERIPVQVFRPSIVVGDEQSGWTASFNVMYAPLRAYVRGDLPLVPARRSAPVDVVPVSYVARAILELADAGAGKTFQLVAGPEASSIGELVERTVRHFDGPPIRMVAPALYRRVIHPLLMRRASPARRAGLERASVFFPYFSSRVRFASEATRAELAPAGLEPPPLGDYLERLLDFAVDTSWGRHPRGRAEALAARAPLPVAG